MRYDAQIDGRTRRVTIERRDSGLAVSVDGRACRVDAVQIGAHTWSLIFEDAAVDSPPRRSYEVTVAPDPASGQLVVRVGGTPIAVSLNGTRGGGRADAAHGDGPQRIVAPMPGKIVRVGVKQGEAVRARQPLVVVEAMKMENELRAARDGTVGELHAREGMSVDAGTLLVVIQ